MPATQQNRFIAIGTPLGEDVVLLNSFSVRERMSRPFEIEAELASEDPAIDFDQIVGHNVTIRLQTDDGKTRYFNGFVSSFVQLVKHAGFSRYRATIVPWLWFLSRTADCRIFQQKTVKDILTDVFQGHGFHDFELRLTATYPTFEYCVQYRETDFNFVSRLMEQAGIYYYFAHENGKHTLVLADSASAHAPFPDYATVEYSELKEGAEQRQHITDWTVEAEVQAVSYAINDFDFKRPKMSLRSVSNIGRNHGAAGFEMFDHPGEYVDGSEGERLAKVRIEELQAQFKTSRGQATARGLATGYTFTMTNHPRADWNVEYLIVGATLQASAGDFGSSQESHGDHFSYDFTTIESAQPFRAPRLTPKPMAQGLQTAIVVGPGGEEIYTDEFGRVKVQFHWDRYANADEKSSCWIRVSQAWAGKQWGAMYLPRIGQEVIVEFLEGDPDRPLITGRVYNGEAMPPYSLPAEQTKSTLKSSSSKGGSGFNEIRFEDKKGKEQIFIHGEKDEDVRIKHDSREWIGNDRHLIVNGNQLELVGGNKNGTVKGDALSLINGDHHESTDGGHFSQVFGDEHHRVGGAQNLNVLGDASFKAKGNWNNKCEQKISVEAGTDINGKAGQNYAMDAGMAVHIKAGMTLVLEAGMQISLKVGGNFIDIGPAGVSITGTMVLINSGGAAGSGSGSSPTAPTAPEEPDSPKKPAAADDAGAGGVTTAQASPITAKPGSYDSTKVSDEAAAVEEPEPSPAAQVLKEAAEDGTPFCEECARAAAAQENGGGG